MGCRKKDRNLSFPPVCELSVSDYRENQEEQDECHCCYQHPEEKVSAPEIFKILSVIQRGEKDRYDEKHQWHQSCQQDEQSLRADALFQFKGKVFPEPV